MTRRWVLTLLSPDRLLPIAERWSSLPPAHIVTVLPIGFLFFRTARLQEHRRRHRPLLRHLRQHLHPRQHRRRKTTLSNELTAAIAGAQGAGAVTPAAFDKLLGGGLVGVVEI